MSNKITIPNVNTKDIKVLDNNGRQLIVSNVYFEDNNTVIDFSNYSEGVYFIKVEGLTFKIVK